jgi:hypothetical protein
MITVHDPVKTLQKELETWGTPFVELDCFGTDSGERIAGTMDEFCRAHLGSKLRGYLFYGASVGITHGCFEDGRNVVIKKVRPSGDESLFEFDPATLDTICR